MSEFQKVIKYCAMAFAAFLAFSIITGIVTAVFALAGFVTYTPGKGVKEISKSFEAVRSLDVEHGLGTLYIKAGEGDKILVEARNVNKNLIIDKSAGGKLSVKNEFNFWDFINGNNKIGSKSEITIYVPENFEADRVKLDAGAGNINIEFLDTEKLDINAGAGNINGSKITAEQVKLDGGVGDIILAGVNFTDADIDSGVGNIEIQGSLYGKNKIDCGVGNLTLDILQKEDDFNLKLDKGLGSIHINGRKYSNLDWNDSTADNVLDINGGVGNIDINFND